ncbi:hypothetical protein [Beijerinckia mobilis]|uniref:hypothetical protein n=1 Tax=Beijerinckia mobilis TaxID=231434 RepID=UPI000A03556E
MTLLHNRILIEARRKLAYTSLTVREIAFILGYSGPAYFSRLLPRRWVTLRLSGARAYQI